MTDLRIQQPLDDGMLSDWQHVGCSTVRPPDDGGTTATVISRVLPAHRGRGFGEELYLLPGDTIPWVDLRLA